ncbi:(2Fe-2S)-binding protein [Phenylobacterium zucineum]
MFRKLQSKRSARSVTIMVDGQALLVEEGEPLSAILLRTPPHISRTTPIGGAARAPFCMMGVCFDCLAEVDGEVSSRTCMIRARHGMVVRRQSGRPDPLSSVEQ